MNFSEKVKNAQSESKGREVFRFPFGKYKDKLLKEIPDSYLEYALEKFDLDFTAYYFVKEELANREIDPSKRVRDDWHRATKNKHGTYFIREPNGIRDDLEPMIDSLFRKLSLKYHPDRGGSDKEMAVVNNLKEEFIRLLKQEGIIE